MTRIFNFAKIDFLRIRNFKWIALFPLLVVIIFLTQPDTSPLYILCYCIFAGIIFSTLPCAMESATEVGFLQMLPTLPGEQQKGHFLFGFLFTLLAFLSGIVSIFICHLLRPSFQMFTAGGWNLGDLYLIILGISLIFVGIQTFVLSILRFKSAQAMAILRMIPAFVFLFGMSGLFGEDGITTDGSIQMLSRINGIMILVICLVIYLILAQAAAIIVTRKH